MSLFASVSFYEILQHPFVESLGWTLLHSLWQGAVVAVVLGILLIFLTRSPPSVRYWAACIGLLVLLAMPLTTLAFLASHESTAALATAGVVVEAPQRPVEGVKSPVSSAVVTSSLASVQMDTAPSLPVAEPAIQESSSVAIPPAQQESFIIRCERRLRPWLPGVAMLWCCGVVLLSVRLFVAWFCVERLKNGAVQTGDNSKLKMLHALSARLGVKQVVRLLESSLVEVPTVIGWLKPVILLPIATVNSLTVSQLEAILAHELAHIRRADYVVNVLQSVIETLLFYHPAVWWISSVVRQEREHCCDDLAASISGDKAGYVTALVRIRV